jgi:hypothetical protein
LRLGHNCEGDCSRASVGVKAPNKGLEKISLQWFFVTADFSAKPVRPGKVAQKNLNWPDSFKVWKSCWRNVGELSGYCHNLLTVKHFGNSQKA